MEKLNKVFKTGEISEIDRYTIEHEPISSVDLMERAAGIWTEKFLCLFKKINDIAVLAGNGNNGGDGYVIARLLAQNGQNVKVFRILDGKMSPDCELNYDRWINGNGEIVRVKDVADINFAKDTIIIDAIYGAGLNRPITGFAADVIRKINALPNKVIAVDMPSGLMGEDNSANDRTAVIEADCTLTFQFPKIAFMLPENSRYVGEWTILNIGLHPGIIKQKKTSYYYLTEAFVCGLLPKPDKFAHKGTNGRGLLIAGSDGMMGAAVLAAKAAVRSGVGLLYSHIPGHSKDILQETVPESLLSLDESEVCFSGINDVSRYNAVAIGPAIGQSPETVKGLVNLLETWKGVTILDADALNILSTHPELMKLLHNKCILTPHIKEFERLAGKSQNDFDRLNKLSTFASQYDVCVILKGAYTVIAKPEGELCFNMTGNPGMAKGGMGDVLTGVLLGLAAGGSGVWETAMIGVYAHGMAGDIAASEHGLRGLSSGIVAETIGKAWKQLEVSAGN